MQIVKKRFIFFTISLILIVGGIASMIVNSVRGNGAFNLDIQFTGGVSITANVPNEATESDIKDIVKDVIGKEPNQTQIADVTDGKSAILKFKELSDKDTLAIEEKLEEKYKITADDFSVQQVSATISAEMLRTSILSVVVACIAMLIYVSIRFKDIKKGSSAIVALVHDALIVLGAYSLFRIPMNNNFIAAILTVIGYSINDTIVVFDRIRENTRSVGRRNYEGLVNLSVKQTLARSLFTSLTTFVTVAALYVFGESSVRQFALPIAVGILVGTYSSIFVACNLWYMLCSAFDKSKKAAKSK